MNRQREVPGVPLTGGTGSDAFLIGGGVVLLAGIAVGLRQRIVRRRRT